MAAAAARVLLLLLCALLSGVSANASARQLLLTQGCSDCCFAGNCRAAFNGMPGICCSRQSPGCCPLGAQCVRCAARFVCSNSAFVTKRDRCNMCAQRADTPPDCMGSANGSVGAIIFLGLLVVLCFCCFFMQNNNVVASRHVYSEPVMGSAVPGYPAAPGYPATYGQPMMSPPVYAGGYGGWGGGGSGFATGAATGFVGGMMMNEMMDHGGHHGGGGFEGGGGGDAGFEADM